MDHMTVNMTWGEAALRLGLSALAGGLVGINRSEQARPAGLRTNMLVCLAASFAMVQMNFLLPLSGKNPDSFVVMDLMRLPLGILSGMGFIGAGAILRKDSFVMGVTTAATLWYVTVMGLCFGGGQIGLGLVALVLALAILWGLKWFERVWKHEHRATLTLVAGGENPTEEEICATLEKFDFKIDSWAVAYTHHADQRKITCDIRWRRTALESRPPPFVDQLVRHPRVLDVEWKPLGKAD